MRKLPIPNALMIAFLVMLTGVQLALVFEFWSSFDAGGGFFEFIIIGLGLGLALVELVALIVCSDAASRGDHSKANLYRFVFVMLFLLNLVGDIGAIVTYTSRDGEHRAIATVQYDDATKRVEERDERILSLRRTLTAQNLDGAASGLRAQADTMRDRIDEEGISPQTRSWRQNQWAKLEGAAKTAEAIEKLETERDSAQALISETGARPTMFHPQFEALAKILGWFGASTSPDEVRIGIALALAVVLRFALAFGFWVATPNGQGRGILTVSPGNGGDAPAGDGADWPWPAREGAPSPTASREDFLDTLDEMEATRPAT